MYSCDLLIFMYPVIMYPVIIPQAKTARLFLSLNEQKSKFERNEHQGEGQHLGKDRRISQPGNGLTGKEVESSDQYPRQ